MIDLDKLLLIARWRCERPDEYWKAFSRYITYYRLNRKMSSEGRVGSNTGWPADPDLAEYSRSLMDENYMVLGSDYDALTHIWCRCPEYL